MSNDQYCCYSQLYVFRWRSIKKTIQIKTKKTYRFKKNNLLAQTHKRRQIKLLNFLAIHFYKVWLRHL